ncbi:hypothetical protein [Aestuariibacter salexigens]|uniref:hypothetical protein n=1 Tax=Aestuariibacter salexigens TaxID=226010 RepID=UPI0005536F14|nr:hypothetical protein [Aestuariibacter salexigens]
MKIKMHVLFISFISSILLTGCGGETGEKPWHPYSYSDSYGDFYIWLASESYEDKDTCIKAAKYALSDSEDPSLEDPHGCIFYSNNYILAAYNYWFNTDREHIYCLFETYNPDAVENKSRYYPLLKSTKREDIKPGSGECITEPDTSSFL